ncbi:MAG: hypothetical protein ACPF8V_11900 [Luteibaculum sp.]
MLSLDLGIMGSNTTASHTSLPIFSCNNHLLELVMNRNFNDDWQIFSDSEVFYLVLDGSMNLHLGGGRTKEINRGEYILIKEDTPFMLSDKEGCNYLAIHKKSYNRDFCTEPKEKADILHGNFLNDLSFQPLQLNNHLIQLIYTKDFSSEEAFLDSDRAVFVIEGELVLADVYGEEILNSQEIANIPAHAFHRVHCREKTLGFTLQKMDTRIMYLDKK